MRENLRNMYLKLYSDDLSGIYQYRETLQSHPISQEAWSYIYNASFCRLFCIVMVSNIEFMLQVWKSFDQKKILEVYFKEFSDDGKKIKNGERIRSLRDAFIKSGIKVNRDVFEDYLAIKYIRNAIIHADLTGDYYKGSLYKSHVSHIKKRNFPTDLTNFNDSHWERIQDINFQMMNYIKQTDVYKEYNPPCFQINSIVPGKKDIYITRIKDIHRIYWSNIEKYNLYFSNVISNHIEHTNYDWANKSLLNIKTLNKEEQEIEFLKSMFKLSLGGVRFNNCDYDLVQEAIESWIEFWNITFRKNNISLDLLESIHHAIDGLLMGRDVTKKEREMLNSNINNIYQYAPNVSAVSLLNKYLPIISPSRLSEFIFEGEKAFVSYTIRNKYYLYKNDMKLNGNESNQYRNIITEYKKITSEQ